MDNWTKKCWGKTKNIIDTPHYSKHELELEACGYCSIHYHQHRANTFTIHEGIVEIVEFIGPKLERYTLGPDNTHTTPSLVPHMFIVLKDGKMTEEYFPDRGQPIENSDIIRLIEGGKEPQVQDLTDLPERLIQLIQVAWTPKQ